MKRCLILLVLLSLASLLTGCNSGQPQQQLARCTFDAESLYPRGTWLVGDDRQSYVWLCMAAYGYQLNRGRKACAATVSSAAESPLFPQCYEPQARISLLIRRLKETFAR